MDIQLPKKHPIYRYRYFIIGGVVCIVLMIGLLISVFRPQTYRVKKELILVDVVQQNNFLEYVEAEGIVHPILTLKVNATEAGRVERIISDAGSYLNKGDTIMILSNAELLREIDEENDDWEKQRITIKENEIEMAQKSLVLKQQVLQNIYELNRLKKSFNLDQEEFKMGIKSKAQLDLAADEYDYKLKNAELQLESLRQDSVLTVIRTQLLQSDIVRGQRKVNRSNDRLKNLIITAPIAGQLSFVGAIPGQRIDAGSSISEIKVLDQFKVQTSLNEFYIDRVMPGLPASILSQGVKYDLRVSKVNPEVKDRTFSVELLFTGALPDNLRIGKSFRVQIELGQSEESVVIKRGDFFQYTGGEWIYKLTESGGKALRVPIKIGRQNPLYYEVLDGLLPNDRVVISGYDNFADAQELIIY